MGGSFSAGAATAFAVVMATACFGCASGSSDSSGDGAVTGRVQSGGTHIATGLVGATVELFYTDGPPATVPIATATSNGAGEFSMAWPTAPVDGMYFVTASLEPGVKLMAILGPGPAEFVTINELTTVAAAYSLAGLVGDAAMPAGDPLALRIAAAMNANLVDVEAGASSEVLLTTPNGDETNALRSTRSLANLLAACVRAPQTGCSPLFEATGGPGELEVKDTLRALLSVARHPATRVQQLFDLSVREQPYEPPLERVPDAWTLAVKVNNTGSAEFPFGGPANTVFDDQGRAWINNNVIQGQSESSQFLVVLDMAGRPARGGGIALPSPLQGGGVLGPGFGITRNPLDNTVWVGNFGWGGVEPGPGGTGTGSVSHFASDGTPLSPSAGYDGGTARVQGMVVDDAGNVWMASYGNNKLVVFLGGNPERSVEAELDCHPFGVARGADGTVWVATVGEKGLPSDPASCDAPSAVSHWKLGDSSLEQLSSTVVGSGLKSLDVDFDGFAWVASGGDDTVYRLDPTGKVVGSFQGGGIRSPWSVRFDDAGEAWVANFGPMELLPPDNVYRDASVSKLAGPHSPTGLPVGTPLSPHTGYTLPSAGAPVLLFGGTPLGATGDQPSFTPLMRTVSAVPDRAGNLWVSNNWKPNFTSNLSDNPGGDGMVIFLGLAAPTQPGRTQ